MREPDLPSKANRPNTLANGRYTLHRKIDEGGTAHVYLAYDNQEQAWRAIKMLSPDFTKRTALKARFEKEGATMFALDHPNVIQVYEAGSEGENLYIVMEYAEGGSIIGWVEKHGRMPPRMATLVGIEVCAGIQYAHELGVVHRDIKPQNILVDASGTCKVTDFGIAQVLSEVRVTMTGTVMGTIGYMAPEQHESAKHADERADVYSIAASLYTLMNGEAATHLFMADDKDFEGIPPVLAKVIREGAAYRREARFETVTKMGMALQEVLAKLPMDPPTTPPLIPSDFRPPDSLSGSLRTTGSMDPVESRGDSRDSRGDSRPKFDLDRPGSTPSSIIPRRDFERKVIRRPKITSRKDIERQVRIRKAALGVGVSVSIGFLLCLALALIGAWQMNIAETSYNNATEDLLTEVSTQARWMERFVPGLTRAAEIQAAFDEVLKEQNADRREGRIQRLRSLLEQEAKELNERQTESTRAAYKQIEQALKGITAGQMTYDQEKQRLEEVRRSPLGRMGRTLPF